MIKGGTYMWIGLRLSVYSLTKKERYMEQKRRVTNRKRSDAPVTLTR